MGLPRRVAPAGAVALPERSSGPARGAGRLAVLLLPNPASPDSEENPSLSPTGGSLLAT